MKGRVAEENAGKTATLASKTGKGKNKKSPSEDKASRDEPTHLNSKPSSARKSRCAGTSNPLDETSSETARKRLWMSQDGEAEEDESKPSQKKHRKSGQCTANEESGVSEEEEEEADDSDAEADNGYKVVSGPYKNTNLYPNVTVRSPQDTRKKTDKKARVNGKDDPRAQQGEESQAENSIPLGDSLQDASECVLVILAEPQKFDTVKAQVKSKATDHFSVEENHVHFWNAVTPVILPDSCMLHFFVDVTHALKLSDWDELRQLLLDPSTLIAKREGEYMAFIHLQEKLSDLKSKKAKKIKEDNAVVLLDLITLRLKQARKNNRYLLGLFTNISEVDCLFLLVNNISDPEEKLRHILHQPPVLYDWPDSDLICSASSDVPPEQKEAYHLQESMILQNWFTTIFPQLHKALVCSPKDEILHCEAADSSSGAFHALRTGLQNLVVQDDDKDSELPVAILVEKVNTDMIPLQKYIQWNVKKYTKKFSEQKVVLAFHVEGLDGMKHTQISIEEPGRSLKFFSAFNPAEKPVTLVIAVIT